MLTNLSMFRIKKEMVDSKQEKLELINKYPALACVWGMVNNNVSLSLVPMALGWSIVIAIGLATYFGRDINGGYLWKAM